MKKVKLRLLAIQYRALYRRVERAILQPETLHDLVLCEVFAALQRSRQERREMVVTVTLPQAVAIVQTCQRESSDDTRLLLPPVHLAVVNYLTRHNMDFNI